MIRFFKQRRLQRRQTMRLNIKHAQGLADLHKKCFPQAWDASEFESLLVQPSNLCTGVLLGHRVIAFLLLRFAADEAEVLTLAVDPSFRRCGLAQDLMTKGFAQAAFAGAARCHLEVEAANRAAIRLYERLGFKESGRRRGYYVSSGDADAILMTAIL